MFCFYRIKEKLFFKIPKCLVIHEGCRLLHWLGHFTWPIKSIFIIVFLIRFVSDLNFMALYHKTGLANLCYAYFFYSGTPIIVPPAVEQ